MTQRPGDEFRLQATPNEAVARRLAYLASQDNGSVMTGGFKRDDTDAADRNGNKATEHIAEMMDMAARQEQLRQEQIARLSDRFDALENAAREALIDAENDLAAILSNANRATDGRAVFEDKDGNIRDEDGQIVDESALDMSEWDSKASSWETLSQHHSVVERAHDFYERIQETGDRLDDGLDGDDLAAFEDELDAFETELAAFETTAKSPSENNVDQAQHSAPEQFVKFDALKPM